MGYTKCSACPCTSSTPLSSIHRANTHEKYESWKKACHDAGIIVDPQAALFLCCNHFEDKAYITKGKRRLLAADAVPTVFKLTVPGEPTGGLQIGREVAPSSCSSDVLVVYFSTLLFILTNTFCLFLLRLKLHLMTMNDHRWLRIMKKFHCPALISTLAWRKATLKNLLYSQQEIKYYILFQFLPSFSFFDILGFRLQCFVCAFYS
jgi:hypothetical protein